MEDGDSSSDKKKIIRHLKEKDKYSKAKVESQIDFPLFLFSLKITTLTANVY